MPRGCDVTAFERGQIAELVQAGNTISEIARRINRSRSLVRNCISRGISNPTPTRPGRKPKITPRLARRIIRLLNKKAYTASEIRRELNLNIHPRTLSRFFRVHGFKYLKFKTQPKLTSTAKIRRIDFAENYLEWREEWSKVLFVDEKKFNLDGPDGLSYYWQNCQGRQRNIFSTRVFGGGSVMVFLGISSEFKTQISFINGTLDSNGYKNILRRYAIPTLELIGDHSELYQDNAPIHSAESTQDWLEDHGIDVLPSPTSSPDLNPIENVFGMLARFTQMEDNTLIRENYVRLFKPAGKT
jgi:transposase